MVIELKLGHSYPSKSPPSIKIKGFYEKFCEQVSNTLIGKWSSDMMILYEYYTYCQSELSMDVIDASRTLALDNIEY